MELATGVLLLGGAVVGIVEFVKRLTVGDWRVALIILASGLAGYVLAQSPEIGVTPIQGMVAGFSVSGYIMAAKLAQK